jgi:hypothetical protein
MEDPIMKVASFRKLAKPTACLVVGLVASATFMSQVDARTIGAYAGRPLHGRNVWPCFSESSGGVRGTGALGCYHNAAPSYLSEPSWSVQLPVDFYNQKQVDVALKTDSNPQGQTLACALWVYDQYSDYFGTSTVEYAQNQPTFHIVSLYLPVPNNGYLYLACGTLFNSSYQIGSITWTP